MSTLSRSTFETTYVNAAGTFADNSTRDISEGDMRQYADDVSDSTVFKNDDYDFWLKTITASGTDTYTITPTIPAAYASDEKWLIRFTNSNTGASTLNRNSLGAKALLNNTGGALIAGDIVAGGVYIVNYNGTNYRVLNVVVGSGSVSGLTTPRIPYATSGTTLGDNAGLIWDNTNAFLSLGAGASPDRQFHIEKESAATNTVTYLQRITSLSSGTPAAGIGVGIEFEVETAAANNEVGGTFEVAANDVIPTSEDFDAIIKLMSGGAAATERLRITSDGRLYGTVIHKGSYSGTPSLEGATNQYIASGTYTPTVTGVTNVTSAASPAGFFLRVGNVVTVAGSVTIDHTANALTEFTISVPIASGTLNSGSAQYSPGNIVGVSTSILISGYLNSNSGTANTTKAVYLSGTATTILMLFHFSYTVT